MPGLAGSPLYQPQQPARPTTRDEVAELLRRMQETAEAKARQMDLEFAQALQASGQEALALRAQQDQQTKAAQMEELAAIDQRIQLTDVRDQTVQQQFGMELDAQLEAGQDPQAVARSRKLLGDQAAVRSLLENLVRTGVSRAEAEAQQIQSLADAPPSLLSGFAAGSTFSQADDPATRILRAGESSVGDFFTGRAKRETAELTGTGGEISLDPRRFEPLGGWPGAKPNLPRDEQGKLYGYDQSAIEQLAKDRIRKDLVARFGDKAPERSGVAQAGEMVGQMAGTLTALIPIKGIGTKLGQWIGRGVRGSGALGGFASQMGFFMARGPDREQQYLIDNSDMTPEQKKMAARAAGIFNGLTFAFWLPAAGVGAKLGQTVAGKTGMRGAVGALAGQAATFPLATGTSNALLDGLRSAVVEMGEGQEGMLGTASDYARLSYQTNPKFRDAVNTLLRALSEKSPDLAWQAAEQYVEEVGVAGGAFGLLRMLGLQPGLMDRPMKPEDAAAWNQRLDETAKKAAAEAREAAKAAGEDEGVQNAAAEMAQKAAEPLRAKARPETEVEKLEREAGPEQAAEDIREGMAVERAVGEERAEETPTREKALEQARADLEAAAERVRTEFSDDAERAYQEAAQRVDALERPAKGAVEAQDARTGDVIAEAPKAVAAAERAARRSRKAKRSPERLAEEATAEIREAKPADVAKVVAEQVEAGDRVEVGEGARAAEVVEVRPDATVVTKAPAEAPQAKGVEVMQVVSPEQAKQVRVRTKPVDAKELEGINQRMEAARGEGGNEAANKLIQVGDRIMAQPEKGQAAVEGVVKEITDKGIVVQTRGRTTRTVPLSSWTSLLRRPKAKPALKTEPVKEAEKAEPDTTGPTDPVQAVADAAKPPAKKPKAKDPTPRQADLWAEKAVDLEPRPVSPQDASPEIHSLNQSLRPWIGRLDLAMGQAMKGKAEPLIDLLAEMRVAGGDAKDFADWLRDNHSQFLGRGWRSTERMAAEMQYAYLMDRSGQVMAYASLGDHVESLRGWLREQTEELAKTKDPVHQAAVLDRMQGEMQGVLGLASNSYSNGRKLWRDYTILLNSVARGGEMGAMTNPFSLVADGMRRLHAKLRGRKVAEIRRLNMPMTRHALSTAGPLRRMIPYLETPRNHMGVQGEKIHHAMAAAEKEQTQLLRWGVRTWKAARIRTKDQFEALSRWLEGTDQQRAAIEAEHPGIHVAGREFETFFKRMRREILRTIRPVRNMQDAIQRLDRRIHSLEMEARDATARAEMEGREPSGITRLWAKTAEALRRIRQEASVRLGEYVQNWGIQGGRYVPHARIEAFMRDHGEYIPKAGGDPASMQLNPGRARGVMSRHFRQRLDLIPEAEREYDFRKLFRGYLRSVVPVVKKNQVLIEQRQEWEGAVVPMTRRQLLKASEHRQEVFYDGKRWYHHGAWAYNRKEGLRPMEKGEAGKYEEPEGFKRRIVLWSVAKETEFGNRPLSPQQIRSLQERGDLVLLRPDEAIGNVEVRQGGLFNRFGRIRLDPRRAEDWKRLLDEAQGHVQAMGQGKSERLYRRLFALAGRALTTTTMGAMNLPVAATVATASVAQNIVVLGPVRSLTAMADFARLLHRWKAPAILGGQGGVARTAQPIPEKATQDWAGTRSLIQGHAQAMMRSKAELDAMRPGRRAEAELQDRMLQAMVTQPIWSHNMALMFQDMAGMQGSPLAQAKGVVDKAFRALGAADRVLMTPVTVSDFISRLHLFVGVYRPVFEQARAAGESVDAADNMATQQAVASVIQQHQQYVRTANSRFDNWFATPLLGNLTRWARNFAGVMWRAPASYKAKYAAVMSAIVYGAYEAFGLDLRSILFTPYENLPGGETLEKAISAAMPEEDWEIDAGPLGKLKIDPKYLPGVSGVPFVIPGFWNPGTEKVAEVGRATGALLRGDMETFRKEADRIVTEMAIPGSVRQIMKAWGSSVEEDEDGLRYYRYVPPRLFGTEATPQYLETQGVQNWLLQLAPGQLASESDAWDFATRQRALHERRMGLRKEIQGTTRRLLGRRMQGEEVAPEDLREQVRRAYAEGLISRNEDPTKQVKEALNWVLDQAKSAKRAQSLGPVGKAIDSAPDKERRVESLSAALRQGRLSPTEIRALLVDPATRLQGKKGLLDWLSDVDPKYRQMFVEAVQAHAARNR